MIITHNIKLGQSMKTLQASQNRSIKNRDESKHMSSHNQDRYIRGLTRQQVSQFITSFPFIYEIYKKNQPNNQWKLLDQLMKVPSQTDGPGFIYGFMNEKQNSLLQAPYWIKIGRTKQNPPQQRIFQWQRDDDIPITQIFTVRSLHNKKLQSLVHILFSYAHKNRVINNKNRIQWFRFEEITLTAAAVNILNHIMNSIHAKKLQHKNNKYQISSQSLLKQNKQGGNNTSLYMNRNLKQITDKINQSNTQIKNILSNDTKNTVDSFIRDLGIELGRNQQLKIKLRDCDYIQQILQAANTTAIGKQMNQLFHSMSQFQNIFNSYLDKINQFRNYTVANAKQIYDKTTIHLNIYSNPTNIKQTKPLTPAKKTQPKITTNQSQQVQSRKKTASPQRRASKSKQKPVQKLQQTQQQGQKVNKLKQRRRRARQKKQQLARLAKQQQLRQNQMVQQKYQRQQVIVTSEPPSSQTPKINQNSFKKIKQAQSQNTSKLSVGVYNADGEFERKQTIQMKQIQKSNQNLKKYRQVRLPEINHKKSEGVDLNQTKTQQQLREEVQNLSASQHTLLQFTHQKISMLVPQQITKIGHRYIVYAKSFTIDQKQLKLNCAYLIMTKKLIIKQQCSIVKNDNKEKKFKGFLKVYCFNMQGQRMLKIDKNCQKYVTICKVKNEQDITVVDQYHKAKSNIDDVDRSMSVKLLKLFQSA